MGSKRHEMFPRDQKARFHDRPRTQALSRHRPKDRKTAGGASARTDAYGGGRNGIAVLVRLRATSREAKGASPKRPPTCREGAKRERRDSNPRPPA